MVLLVSLFSILPPHLLNPTSGLMLQGQIVIFERSLFKSDQYLEEKSIEEHWLYQVNGKRDGMGHRAVPISRKGS